MLWNPAFVAACAAKPDVSSALPAIASPVWVLDTTRPDLIFLDVNGTTVATASGNPVARVNNVLGGSTSWQQATVGKQPSLLADTVTGKWALRFAGAGQMLSLAGITNPGSTFQSRSFTFAMVLRLNVRADYTGLFSAGNNAGGLNGYGYDMILLEAVSTGIPKLYRMGGSDEANAALSAPTYAGDGKLMKVVARGDATNGLELRVKSLVGNFKGSGGMPGSADSFPWDAAFLGAELGYGGNAGPLYPMQGDLFEFRWWNARATDAQADQLQGYADLKWGN